jgi:hypothetical protein
MAFTLAHIAAILPFHKSCRKLPFDALAIGAIVPDLPYFINSPNYIISHQWKGIIIYCLPYGLIILSLWRILIRDVFLKMYIGESISTKNYNVKKLIVSLFYLNLAIIIGCMTHLIWDGVTHPNGFIAVGFEFLQYQILIYNDIKISISRLLQYTSSVIGLLILYRLFLSREVNTKYLFNYRKRRRFNFFITFVILGASIISIDNNRSEISDFYLFVSSMLVDLGKIMIASAIVLCLVYKIYKFLR